MATSIRICKYGCQIQLGDFDTKQNKYLETDGKTLHTRKRCESLKNKQPTKQETNGHNGNNNDLNLEVFLKKLESIGITIDLNKLRNAK